MQNAYCLILLLCYIHVYICFHQVYTSVGKAGLVLLLCYIHVYICFHQAYTSVGKAGLVLRDNQALAKHMNTIVFHTKMVDYLDQVLIEASDLSIYW